MLKCGPSRGQFIQAHEQLVTVRELHTATTPGPKAVSRGEAPKLAYSSKLVKSFEHSSVVQCLDWSPAGESFALGCQDGTVSVCTVSAHQDVRTIPPRQQRACKSVKYQDRNSIAIGHDKVRNDFSLSIYDLEKQTVSGTYANSEAVSSLCFMPRDPHCVIAGLNQRWLRIIDTRIQSKDNYTVVSIPTPAVYEITASQDNHTYASTHDNNILIWDRRKDDGPLLSLKSNASSPSCRVNQLRYFHSQGQNLAALSNDGMIDFWNLSTAHDEQPMDGYRVLYQRATQTHGRIGFDFVETPADFKSAWNIIVSTSDSGSPNLVSTDRSAPVTGYTNLSDFVIFDQNRLRFERSPLRGISKDALESSSFPTYMQTLMSDSENSSDEDEDDKTVEEATPRKSHPLLTRQLTVRDILPTATNSRKLQEAQQPNNQVALTSYFDVSSTMYKRAKLGYGLDPEHNSSLSLPDSLKTIWTWLAWTARANETEQLRTDGFDFAYEGCLNIWNGTGGNLKKSLVPKAEQFMEAVAKINDNFDSDIFPDSITAAPLRQLALISTGWCMTTAEFIKFRERLIVDGDYAKAAFYSVAQDRDILKAVEIMNQSGVMMDEAVSEFRDARGKDEAARDWREKWPEHGIDLDSPYIRAIFAYLSANDWRDVIDEQGLSLRERLSLTLRYIRDEEVGSILQDLCRTEVAEGNLEGLLLTGVKAASLDLLQAYVDRTSDVQTAALIIALTPDLCSDRRALCWIHEYKTFLMTSGLFLQKCRYDVARTKLSRHSNKARTTLKQVSFRCNHCNTVIDHAESQEHDHPHTRNSSHRLHGPPRTSGLVKSTLCANCRKALPKCILCLLPVGKDSLMSVCLTCNHTLHHDHATDWFKKQNKCPAPQCLCHCQHRDHVHT